MPKAQTTAVKPALSVEDVMAQLRKPKAASTSLTDILVNKVADSGQTIARLGAGLTAAADNMQDAYAMERERQLKRRAERIVAFAAA